MAKGSWKPQVARIPKPDCQHKLAGYNIGHLTCAHCDIEWLWISGKGWKLTNY